MFSLPSPQPEWLNCSGTWIQVLSWIFEYRKLKISEAETIRIVVGVYTLCWKGQKIDKQFSVTLSELNWSQQNTTPKEKSTSEHLFWCFRLSQIEDSIQYLEGPNSTWKDHDMNLGVQIIPTEKSIWPLTNHCLKKFVG